MRISAFLRPPYLLGILCFIPVVGVLIGITLIFLGIFHYKNKFLVALGVIGILFTVALFIVAFHGKQG